MCVNSFWRHLTMSYSYSFEGGETGGSEEGEHPDEEPKNEEEVSGTFVRPFRRGRHLLRLSHVFAGRIFRRRQRVPPAPPAPMTLFSQ